MNKIQKKILGKEKQQTSSPSPWITMINMKKIIVIIYTNLSIATIFSSFSYGNKKLYHHLIE